MFDLDVISTKNMIERINLDDLVERVVDILRISDQEIFNSVVNKKMNAEFGYEVADTCKYYLSEFVEEGKATVIDVTDNVDKIFVKLAQPLQMLEDERWNID